MKLSLYFAICSALGVWTVHSFEKVTLTDNYFCDGITHGDINGDGKPDIVAGPFWYAGPDFKTGHEFYKAVPFELPPSPTDSMFSFVEDFDGDGWQDILVCGRVHKHSAYWYRNPGEKLGEGEHWEKHFVFERIRGESPTLVDIDKDGTKELICHWDDRWGWVAPDPDDPTKPWKFHAISIPWKYNQFYHGTGVGDVNGDGRDDLIINDGWWEQPEKPAPLWEFHKYKFGEKGGAQMFAYDVDRDGDNDIITSLDAHGWGLAWFEQVGGEEQFKKHMIMGSREEEKKYGVAFSQPHALAMADIDHDGVEDIIVGKRMWAHGPKGDVEPGADPVIFWFKLNNRIPPHISFVPHLIDSQSGVGVQISTADMDDDGKVDILTASKLGSFYFRSEVPGWISVFGEVREPRAIPSKKGMTLGEAIRAAGGFTESADGKRVKVTRRGKSDYYDLRDARSKKFRPKPGDAINVMPLKSPSKTPDVGREKAGVEGADAGDDTRPGIIVSGFPRFPSGEASGERHELKYIEGTTLLDVIAQTGGFGFRQPYGTFTILREGRRVWSRHSSKISGQDSNPRLQAGDTVTFTHGKEGLDKK